LRVQHVLLTGAGFFLGRAVLLGELLPFGVAFVAASLWIYGRGGMAALVGVLAGLITVASGVQLSSGVVAVVAVALAVQAIPAGIKKQWLVVPGLVLAVLIVTKTGFLAFGDPPPYVYISVIFEAVFAGALTLVLLYGLPSLVKLNSGKTLGGEEIFCIVIILVAIIAGAGQLEVDPVSLKGVLSRVVVLVAALAGGPGLGAAAGAVVGIIPGLAYAVTPAVVGAYSFAGLLAGLFRNLGKPGVLVGFLLGNIILSVYVANYGDLAGVVAETALAGLLFLVLPAAVLNRWRKAVFNGEKTGPGSENNETVAREAVARRMRRWSGVFRQLAGTFQQAAGSVERAGGKDSWQGLFNQIGDKVCTGCALYRTCWERDFYNTYQKMLDLFAVAEAHGRVTPDDIGDDIRRRCSRIKELAITVTCLYELHKLNRYWSRRVSESRGIVYEQLKGVSEIINNLSRELEQDRKYDDEKAFQLRQKFREFGLPVAGLGIINSDREGAEIEISLPASPDINAEIKQIADFVSDFMGCPYAPAATNYPWGDEDIYAFYLYPGLNYGLELGLARRAKGDNTVSGDSYSFLSLPGGKLALFLSDGMGAGPGAAAESSAAISLLQYLLESGFDRDLALKTLNSLLMLNSPEDSFATVDMVVVDLYSARVEFVKIGAPPSFFVREGRVGLIRADSLPAGIISDIEVFAVSREMNPGDMLVMVTDGIFDTYPGGGDKEDWISNVLQEVVSLPPQDVADLILRLACTGTGQQVKPGDDMTVLVARLAIN
jgi:stage II sporulation protein E